VQRGHAVSNAMPVVAANRIGLETASVDPATGHAGAAEAGDIGIRFYGSSFIADQTGALLAEASRDREEVVIATVDLDSARYHREDWSFFRDRRPELYRPLLSLDGEG
jgi:N-carbamoylputrescine amidase